MNGKITLTKSVWEKLLHKVYEKDSWSTTGFIQAAEQLAAGSKRLDNYPFLEGKVNKIRSTAVNKAYYDLVYNVRKLDPEAAVWIQDWAPVQNYALGVNAQYTDLKTAFSWWESPQGKDYWSNLHCKMYLSDAPVAKSPAAKVPEQEPVLWVQARMQKEHRQHVISLRNEVRAMISGSVQFHDDPRSRSKQEEWPPMSVGMNFDKMTEVLKEAKERVEKSSTPKFEVGDLVVCNKQPPAEGEAWSIPGYSENMYKYLGKPAKVTKVLDRGWLKLDVDGSFYFWNPDWMELIKEAESSRFNQCCVCGDTIDLSKDFDESDWEEIHEKDFHCGKSPRCFP